MFQMPESWKFGHDRQLGQMFRYSNEGTPVSGTMSVGIEDGRYYCTTGREAAGLVT